MLDESSLYFKDPNLNGYQFYPWPHPFYRDNSTAENSDNMSELEDQDAQTDHYGKSKFVYYSNSKNSQTDEDKEFEIE